jgi:putative DNA primase/helicase
MTDVLSRLRRVRRCGSGWSAACPAHDDRRNSLSVAVRDGRVLLYCHASCEFSQILRALNISRPDLRVEGGTIPVRSREERIRSARRLWEKSQPPTGTVVEEYLAARSITGPIPRSIRSVGLLMHDEYGWPFPALVAGLQDAAGAFTAVSVTWLCADGSGKAPADPVRKIYGPYRGSSVRLAPALETLVVCEGIETGLSIVQACSELPVWCALSATNLRQIALPQSVREVFIAADGDVAGEAAAQQAAQRFLREGRRVRVARPDREGSDFNDYLTK